MELINATRMQAGYTLGMEPSGREHVVVAVKGTYSIPETAEAAPRLAEQQRPLVEADTFTGEPGFSAPVLESDYPLRKPRCDVLLLGSAYAPDGRPATRVRVGFTMGPVAKGFDVVGDRIWEAGLVAIRAGDPAEFCSMPVSYDRAFGGTDDFSPEEKHHSAYMPNPVGRGYHGKLKGSLVDGTPMPNTEAVGEPVRRPNGRYAPMAFGPVGRGWEPRLGYAGTYDQHWLDEVFPFLPADFRDDYYQCAPADQQMPYPRGGEQVALMNLTPGGACAFRLPAVDLPVVFFRKGGERHDVKAVVDTVVLMPDAGVFTMTWRASMPLKRNIFEASQALVGAMPRAWWRARELGKTYYPSLDAAVRAKRAEEVEE